MKNEDEYASSITSNYLRRQLDSCQRISKTGYDNSSVLKCFQDKVNELRVYKEKYFEMEAQLKSANDAIKFQEAEFSFRISELQGEIENLKQIEINLRSQISRNELEKSKNAHIYDVQVSLQIENQKLNQELENQSQRIEMLTEQISDQSSTIASLKGEIESLNQKLRSLKNDLNDKSKKLQREKQKVKIVAQRFNSLKDKYENEKNQNQELNRELQKNKNSKSLSIQKLNDKLKEFQKVINNQNSILNHVESERRKIYELLGVRYENVNESWSNILGACTALQEENEKLRLRINSQEEGQLRISNQRFGNENKVLANQLAKMKLRNHFIAIIDKQNSSFAKQLNELHESVFETDNTNLRAIFLSVIFAQRLIRVFRGPSVVDLSALNIFKGRSFYSPELKLRDLRNKFVQLTQDLLIAKQDWIDSENKIKSIKLELKQANKHIEKSENGNDNYSKQILLLKNRILELQQELSTLISPDQYEKLREEVEVYKTKHDQTVTQKTFDPVYQKMIIEENNQLKEAIVEYEKEIESLNLLLKEKTREILALERVNNRHKNIEKTTKSSFTCLSAENRILNDEYVNQSTRISEPEPVSMFSQKNYGLFCRINPAFLGQ